jgi:hypothetical protein
MKNPNFFIVGAPKCGTTALAHYLSEHPEVFLAEPKEPHYFNTDLDHGKCSDRSAYAALFEGAGSRHKAVGEASVWYLYSDEAVPNILRDIPEARFIVMVRNPVDVAVSLHAQHLFTGFENVRDFHTAWRLQTKRRDGKEIPFFCEEPKLLFYKDACSLGWQVERLIRNASNGRVLVIFFEDFARDPRKIWTEVERFIGVDDDGRREFPLINAAKSRRSFGLKRITDLYARLRRLLGMGGFGTGVFEWLDRWNVRNGKKPTLSEGVRAELVDAFRNDIERLEVATGRDLTQWKAGR